jgi:hypothetical protein
MPEDADRRGGRRFKALGGLFAAVSVMAVGSTSLLTASAGIVAAVAITVAWRRRTARPPRCTTRGGRQCAC